MTTAHRPTFDPAKGKEAQRGPAYHQRLLPAHTQLKVRQAGQGGDADAPSLDLRAQLLQAEAAHYAKKNGGAPIQVPEELKPAKRQLEKGSGENTEEDLETKRRRILEETRDEDAASDDEESESSEEESDDEDETAELLRELEKIKKERAEKKAQEVNDFCDKTANHDLQIEHRNANKPLPNRTSARRTLLLAIPCSILPLIQILREGEA